MKRLASFNAFGMIATIAVTFISCRAPEPVQELKSLAPKTAEPVKITRIKSSPLISIGDFPKSLLRARTTVEQAEYDNLVSDYHLGPLPVPFGFINKDWLAFKQLLQPGDELWTFSEQGGTGLCIVRSQKVIACLTLTMY